MRRKREELETPPRSPRRGESSEPERSVSMEGLMQKAMVNLCTQLSANVPSRKPEGPPEVDMGQMLQDKGLDLLFPPETWPEPAAVRKLVAKLAGVRKKTLDKFAGFTLVDLKEFLPAEFDEHVALELHEVVLFPLFVHLFVSASLLSCEASGELRPASKGSKAPGKYLGLAQWLLAWDRYAIAASITDQLTFAECMIYKSVIGGVCSACRGSLSCVAFAFALPVRLQRARMPKI